MITNKIHATYFDPCHFSDQRQLRVLGLPPGSYDASAKPIHNFFTSRHPGIT